MKKSRIPTIPAWVKLAVPGVAVLFIVGFFGIGWYFSNQLIHLKLQNIDIDQTIKGLDGGRYAISGSAYDIDGIVGGVRPDGSFIGVFSPPTKLDSASQTSSRTLQYVLGKPPLVGDKVSLQGNIWVSDPKKALGIPFQDVTYKSPVGKLHAWIIKPAVASKKWTIAIHGIGAPKSEMLRFIKPVRAAGNNMMIINYRGDRDNPGSPDGYTHLGDTEWQDLEAAVRYAKQHGATDIQLYATSLGGSITESYLRRSSDVATTKITKVILDSPALDWGEILSYRVRKMSYPGFLSKPGMLVSSLRTGINFGRITTTAASIKEPTLIIHNADDKTVPQAASKRLAKARPELVTFVDFGSGGHIRAWNHDPERYEKLVTDFLKQ